MSDLLETHRALLLSHSRHPRHHHELVGGDVRFAEAENPLCNDHVRVFIRLAEGMLKEIAVISTSCAICTASGSFMAERLTNVSVEEAERVFTTVRALLTGNTPPAEAPPLGDVAAMIDIKRFPMRVKCAMLPWHVMHRILDPGDLNHAADEWA